MKVYSDKYKCFSYPCGEFEILNELHDTTKRTDDNCLYHTRFLMEMDEDTLETQKEYFERNKDKICRVTFSGNKSYHFIIEFNKECEDVCSKYYKHIWSYLNEKYFDSKCDVHCNNPSRLTRRPGAFRTDKNCFQKLMYSSDAKISINRDIRSYINGANAAIDQERKTFKSQSANDNKCLTDPVIVKYLSTPYMKLTGNGTSSSELYQSICKCIANGDTTTLEKVLNKARSERWTEGELEHQIKSARKYLENCT